MKKIISCMALVLFISPVFSQDANKDQDKKLDNEQVVQQVYSEQILEDFENTSYTPDKNLKFDLTNQQVADLQIRDQFDARMLVHFLPMPGDDS